MKLNISKLAWAMGLGAAVALPSCSLDEVNPGGFTLESLSTSPAGYETLLNNCYFGLERQFYNGIDFMKFMEGSTDLWTVALNTENKNDEFFKFYGGASPNLTYTNALWNSAYDGIGACNLAIETAPNCAFSSEEIRNAKVAEAHFLRAVYYYNLVEMFGGVVMQTEVAKATNYSPERTAPVEIYRQVIIPDLRFAAANLNTGTYATDGVPTKKAALGMLAKACLATNQYGTTEFLQEGFEAAKTLISDCEGGGAKYNAYMYPTVGEMWAEANNKDNKEALWHYSVYAGSDGHGSSNGNYRTNRNDEHFLCNITHFAAVKSNQDFLISWNGGVIGDFMPTQYLLSLYTQDNGGQLDPRFHVLFNTEWKANTEYKWTDGDLTRYGKGAALKDNTVAAGDLAVKFVMPQDADYAAEVAAKAGSNYILVDYKDVYDDATKKIIMKDGAGENHYRYYYPSLTKHNSSRYYVVNASKNRNGNLNAVIPMRMAEVYLIAAEYDLLLNGGAKAMGYVNVVRKRAGAADLSGACSVDVVLKERARELCGEFGRFFDLKRTGKLKDNTYLMSTHPDCGQYFKPEYALRPIPQNYTDVILNGADFINPGY